MFPITIDPQIIVPIDISKMVHHYYIVNDNKLNDLMVEPVNSLRGFLSIINIHLLQSFEIIKASAEIEFIDGFQEGSLYIFESMDDVMNFKNGYIFDVNQAIAICDKIIDKRKIEYDFSSLVKKWIDNKKENGVIVFFTSNPNYLMEKFPKIIIQYNIHEKAPIDYLKYETTTIIEKISNYEMGFYEDNENKIGFLTTYIDFENTNVLQQYQVQERIFTRTSINETTWSEWTNHNLVAHIVDSVLYLSDEKSEVK